MEDIAYWLALLRTPGVGPHTFNQLLQHFSSPRTLFDAGHSAWRDCGLLKNKSVQALADPSWKLVEQDLDWLQQANNHVITLSHKHFPALLREISDPPPLLFVHGDPTSLNHYQLAMVGSRNPSVDGKANAFDFARHLANQGLAITSGLALGIDAASHQGALSIRGTTIAVAGTGLDRVYPARHRELAHQIAERGALVSEFVPGTPPLAENFPRRNRIISGMSLGTVVVEAALRSGSLITARLAGDQGREVFALPGSIHNPLARGCHKLIRDGAKLVETAADIMEELGALVEFQLQKGENDDIRPTADLAELDQDYRCLLDNLGFEPTPVDAVIERSGLTPDAVSSMLLILELQGHVVPAPGGRYSRTHKARVK